MKPWFRSKTIWLNLITFVIMVGPLLLDNQIGPARYVGLLAPLGNIILRVFFTAEPITAMAASQQPESAALISPPPLDGSPAMMVNISKLAAATEGARAQLRMLGIETYQEAEIATIRAEAQRAGRHTAMLEAAALLEQQSSFDVGPLIYVAAELRLRADEAAGVAPAPPEITPISPNEASAMLGGDRPYD